MMIFTKKTLRYSGLLFIWVGLNFIATFTCNAQTIDSLTKTWKDEGKPAIDRLDAIQALVTSQLTSNPDSSFVLANQMIDLSKELKRPDYQVKTLGNLALIKYVQGKYDEAANYLDQGLILADEIYDRINKANLLRIFGMVNEAKGDNPSALKYYEESLALSMEIQDTLVMARALNSLGIFHQTVLGNADTALEYYYKSLELKKHKRDKLGVAITTYNIGETHYMKGDFTNSIQIYLQALKLFEEIDDQIGIQDVYNAVGNIYNQQGDLSKANEYYHKSYKLTQKTGDKLGQAMALINIGDSHMLQGKLDSAEQVLNSSLAILTEIDNQLHISQPLKFLGDLAFQKNDLNKALEQYQRAYQIAKNQENLPLTSEMAIRMAQSYVKMGRLNEGARFLTEASSLSEWIDNNEMKMVMYDVYTQYYQKRGEVKNELNAYRNYILYRDSLVNENTIREITRQEMNYNFDKKQLADSLEYASQQAIKDGIISREKFRRNAFATGLLLFVLLSGLIYRQYRLTQEARQQSDELLLNILPVQTARELKEKGHTSAKKYSNVTILFSDFKDFTKVAEQMSPEDLVAHLDEYFQAFELITKKFGLEKIKTIGDAYLAVGSMPENNNAQPKDVVNAALQMQQFVNEKKRQEGANGLQAFDMRIGIHTGDVVAGVVGQAKFQYDIWGDAVNMAARMETYSEPGKVNLSFATYELLKDQANLSFKQRPLLKVKNKGDLQMYFVERAS